MSAKPNGSFCWADLVPADQQRAIDFYAALAGWNAAVGGPEFGGYALAFGEGLDAGPDAMAAGFNPSISTIEAFKASAGAPPSDPPLQPGWTVYLATDHIDASIEAATANGGELLMPRMDIPGMGASALVADPTGAAVGLWQGTGHHGFGVYDEPGAFCWAELYSTDAAASRDFFAATFGLEASTLSERPGFTYYRLAVPGQPGPTFGVMQMPESRGDAPSHFGAYLSVADTDAAAERVEAHGGTIVNGPFGSPMGRMASITDSEGAAINIIDTAVVTGAM